MSIIRDTYESYKCPFCKSITTTINVNRRYSEEFKFWSNGRLLETLFGCKHARLGYVAGLLYEIIFINGIKSEYPGSFNIALKPVELDFVLSASELLGLDIEAA